MTLAGLVSEFSVAQHGQWLSVPDPRTWTAGIGIDPGRGTADMSRPAVT
jgi:hypothetical protein